MAKTLEDLTVDELLAYAKSAQPAAELVSAMAKDPALREAWQGLVKKARPDLSIPEYDAKQSVRAEIATEREERQKLERAMMERDARDNVKERRASIKEVNWTHDAAARVYLASRQSATPTPATFAPPTYDMPEKDVWGKGLGNKAALDKIAMGQAFEAWNEIASGKVPGLGAGKAN
jgi:hypothetical protein